MDMVLVGQISVRVVHVLAGVNVEVILLLILDVEEISHDVILVLSEESSNNWVVPLGMVILPRLL